MKKVLIGISGGIAAYKSIELIRKLKKADIDVWVIITKNGLQFVTPLTLKTISGNPVFSDMFAENSLYSMPHISLRENSDLFVIVPATANIISKISHGIADDLLSTIALSFDKKILIAPAMNTKMYQNPIIQENINKIKSFADRYKIIEPDNGKLACGDYGIGRLADIDTIFKNITDELK